MWATLLIPGLLVAYLCITYARHVYNTYCLIQDYRLRTEPLFIISTNPDTGKKPKLKEELMQYCLAIDHSLVIATAARHRVLMSKSGNPLFVNKNPDAPGIKIIAIPFQEGRYCNEDFKKLYPLRIAATIKEERELLHAYYYGVCQEVEDEAASTWYSRTMNGQKITPGSVIDF